MSTELLSQIDMLEKACHDALAHGDDAETIDVLVRTLTTVRFAVSEKNRPIVRGLSNLATAHADMLLSALNEKEKTPLVHTGLARLCTTLIDLRKAVQAEAESSPAAS